MADHMLIVLEGGLGRGGTTVHVLYFLLFSGRMGPLTCVLHLVLSLTRVTASVLMVKPISLLSLSLSLHPLLCFPLVSSVEGSAGVLCVV